MAAINHGFRDGVGARVQGARIKDWETRREHESTRPLAGRTVPVVSKKKIEAEKTFEIIELVPFMFLMQTLGGGPALLARA